MKPIISVQLYSVREAAGKDYEGTIRKIAAMGYPCVEPAGFPGTTVDEAVKLFKELGLKSLSMHSQLPIGENKNEVIETAQKLGAKYIITSKGGKDFETRDSIKAVADQLNEAAANIADLGLSIAYHNHDWEMFDVDGQAGYQILNELIADNVCYELDTYWVKVGKKDPVAVIKELGDKVKLLHIKDGVGYREDPLVMKAVGQGVMNFPAILEAADFAEIAAVELDACATDMMTAVKESYDYLSSII